MATHAGFKSLAICPPSTLRTPAYWRQHFPEVVTAAESRSLGRLFAGGSATSTDPFQIEMQGYLKDPFRGTVECRVLGPEETTLSLELKAARDALAAANMGPGDIDAILAASFVPDRLFPGNAVHLARDLGADAPAWNLESTCSGAVVGIQSAAALVRAGEYRNVLLVTSCSYSRMLDVADTLSWFMGDGAGAAVIGEVPEPHGVLGTKLISTKSTCGAFATGVTLDRQGKPVFRMASGDEEATRRMRDDAAEQLETSATGALAAAGVRLQDIDFFIFNTPTAWFARFCARVLGIDPERTLSVYPRYGNIGAALTMTNLYHAAHAEKIPRGALVLIYAVGSVSTAGATVVRWGDVALGPPPPPSSTLQMAASPA
ncbi:3-oxoacyl-ACP synthase III family protein [Chondromyces apiculatus]|uniref:3-oxoacyl-[acyl-carrier-protein] synthase, KASIII n=1 Tax=Chondromyces apiculatus DSM 436 TaxID=1192034 RepID=A0A017SYT7_9BACT|nr:3-oxoacyl-ACP synthase III family protein [Chondromyces apiculatus]EYF01785.1 3-oxoacyl-[acyl-carrier-protein] synthase, KASIII [Chondromyces apiculatus DSM 436]